MYQSLPYKTKQFLFLLVKLAIIVGALYFIYNKVVHNEQIAITDFLNQLENSIANSGSTILMLLGLSIANWFFEILKWQTLVSFVKKTIFFNALQQSLGSLTASLFTPNRIGEYGAKAIYFTKGIRRKIMLLNLIGNVSQMTITTIFGVVGLFYFFTTYEVTIEFFKLRKLIYFLAFFIAFILFGKRFSGKKIRGFYIDKILSFLKSMPVDFHLKIIAFSVIRYLIFSFQFYFLLTVFKVEIDYFTAITLISSMYLIASLVPSLAFFDWLIKGSVAVWVFSFYPVNELIIVSITLLMWILNFAIPAIFGSYFVLNFNTASMLETKNATQ